MGQEFQLKLNGPKSRRYRVTGTPPVVTNAFVLLPKQQLSKETNEFVTTGVMRVPFRKSWLEGSELNLELRTPSR